MKKIIAFTLVLILLFTLCACGADSTKKSSSNKNDTQTPGDIVENIPAPNLNAEVDLYLRIYDFSGEGAEAYVENLKAENPDATYRYYNDEFYIQTITEQERLEKVTELYKIDELAASLFEDYPGVYIGAEFSPDMSQITFQVNAQAYQNSMAGLVILFGGAIILDQAQAYNLIPIEDRIGTLVVIDENGAVIFNSAEES